MTLKKLLVCVFIGILINVPLLGAIPLSAHQPLSAPDPDSVTPEESVGDCSAYANAPIKATSTTVTGKGGTSCLFNHPTINVVVTVYDVTAEKRSTQGTKSCPGQSSCEVTSGSVPFVSGHYYRTEVSVYYSSSNQYAQSNDIQLR